MATFMDSLAANPSGSSSVYGMPAATTNQDALSLVNQLKDREMRDFKDKANFMDNLSIQHELRARQIFDPASIGSVPTGKNTQDMNQTPFADPNAISAFQKGELGIRQQEADTEKAKLAQSGKLGQEAIDVKTAQEELNKKKEADVNAYEMKKLQTSHDDAIAKLKEANDKVQKNSEDFNAHLNFLKAKQEADDARKRLEDAQRDAAHAETKRRDDATIADLQEKAKQRGATKEQTTEIDPSGNKKVVTTKMGDQAGTVNVIGKDGKQYTIPKDKLDDKDADGTPHWKQVGGG